MSKSIKIIHYDVQSVGRRIKSTKKHFMWRFSLDSALYQIDLFSSKFSGKRTLKVNGEIFFEGKKQGKVFHISMEISSHNIIVIEVKKNYDLRIDGISFLLLKKQADFGEDIETTEENIMSNQLIPEQQEDWEKLAKPYEIIIREGVTTTFREKLPIVPKRNKGKLGSVKQNLKIFYGMDNQKVIEDDLIGSLEYC
ncbi:hypothetical protein SteCoe_2163 [Stentor coeruleus]|uniref:Uncharacterized protein n=1 Tax=Stentor coeruleus TaxID=5963 RepID=A0A1R2D096_9CILI|nr:hypothetical protein SteCoe_2163 [Stentor coeruleus]